MKILWQLKKLSTGEELSELQELPENWGPIFGLAGYKDRLGDLTWCGHPDKGWIEIGPEVIPEETLEDKKNFIDSQVKHLLSESDSMVALDNTNFTKQQRADWFEYRRKLKEIHLQPDYPYTVFWPSKPD